MVLIIDNIVLLITLFFTALLKQFAFILLYKKMTNTKFVLLKDTISLVTLSTISIILALINIEAGMFINNLILILIIKFIYNETFFNAFQYYLIIEALNFIIKFILILPINFIQLNLNINNYLINILGSLSFLILVVILSKIIPLNTYYYKYTKLLRSGNFIIFNLIIYVLALRLLITFNINLLDRYSILLLIISIIYFSISLLFIIYNYKLKEQSIALKTYKKYNPIVSDLIDDIKSRQHDFKNHINTIYGIIQTSNEKALKYKLEDYIISLNNSLTLLDENIQIDNKVVAAIIYVKTNIAKIENINFIYNINCSLNNISLQDYELSEILNNLLDNSFKAVKNEPYSNRIVKLKIDTTTTDYLVETENNGLTLEANKVSKIFNKGFTTKNSANHGYGLYNVKKIVEYYNGKIQLNVNDRFLKISLYIPK